MNISNDILKYNLKNVYFLVGTACGGKTTMGKLLAQKYGWIHFNDNWNEPNFANWEAIQKGRRKEKEGESEVQDMEAYFNRDPQEFVDGLNKMTSEYAEYAIIELIKLSQKNTVVADLHLPADLLQEISEYNKVACLLADPELIIQDYYERDDHRAIYEAIMKLENPEKSLENMNNTFRLGATQTIEEIKASGLFYLMRNADVTVEERLMLLEQHFGLV